MGPFSWNSNQNAPEIPPYSLYLKVGVSNINYDMSGYDLRKWAKELLDYLHVYTWDESCQGTFMPDYSYLISSDLGNSLVKGTDGKLFTNGSGSLGVIVSSSTGATFTSAITFVGSGVSVSGSTVTISGGTGGSGTVTSVGMIVPSAFSVTPSTITTSGIFAITGAGTTNDYIRGDGSLAAFPSVGTGTVTSVATTGLIAGGTITTTGTITTSMNTNKLVGRYSAGTGIMEEITVGSGLSLSSGGTLSVSGSTGGGIPHATASGTDTYTTTIPGVTSYTDGDAYIIQFTNGNTTTSTLNINSLGAINLYRNNDGALIGGDINANGEMLCVYDNTISGFRLIGTSPNTLLAYVTNAESIAITKGQPVYVFGGTGDRITVKLAYNTSDVTSAQTIGVVLTTSIAANQKGFVIVQGQLDGLSLFPTSTWNDGDYIYLDATAGAITNVKPSAPNHLVYLGYVTTASNGAAGRWYVKVQNGYELDELHNVKISGVTNNDILAYESSTSLWKNKQISGVLGYVPQAQLSGVGFVKASGTTISYDNTTYLSSIILTVSGSSGSAAYVSSTSTLNIPTYTLAGLGGANTALSNLASVSINTSLLAQTGVDLGSTANPFRDLYLFSAGTYGTNYFKLTGTPLSGITVTLPNLASYTLAQITNAQTFAGLQTFNNGVSVATGQTYQLGGSNLLYANPSTSTKTLILGLSAGNTSITGNDIVAVGYNAGNALTSTTNTTLVGSEAGFSLTSAPHNTFIGYRAGYNNIGTTGQNTYIGSRSGEGDTTTKTNFNNVGVGHLSLALISSGSYNTVVGYSSANNLKLAINNTFIGASVATSLTTGSADNNTGVGYASLAALTSGVYNTVIGRSGGGTLSTGSYNTLLGSLTSTTSSASHSICIGTYAQATGSNQCVIGADNTSIGRVDNFFLGRGVSTVAANLSSVTLQPTSVTAGVSDSSAILSTLILAGAKGTGTGAGGNLQFSTSYSSSTGSTQNSLVDREIIVAQGKALTSASAISLFEVALPTLKMTGGIIEYTIQCTNGTDMQSISNTVSYTAVNKAGTYTTNITANASNESKSVSSGTLTNSFSILNGTNKVTIQLTATTSLTPSGTNSFVVYYRVKNNSEQSITIL